MVYTGLSISLHTFYNLSVLTNCVGLTIHIQFHYMLSHSYKCSKMKKAEILANLWIILNIKPNLY